MVSPPDRIARARRAGRRVGIAIFAAIVVGATAAWTVEILVSVFAPKISSAAQDCRGGARKLLSAVDRARRAAEAEAGDERAALLRFRTALEPEWGTRPSLDTLCRSDREAQVALSEIDALRYAEEHAVRYEAVGLAPLRRRAKDLDQILFAGDGLSSSSVP